jgi:hypothetical protein
MTYNNFEEEKKKWDEYEIGRRLELEEKEKEEIRRMV